MLADSAHVQVKGAEDLACQHETFIEPPYTQAHTGGVIDLIDTEPGDRRNGSLHSALFGRERRHLMPRGSEHTGRSAWPDARSTIIRATRQQILEGGEALAGSARVARTAGVSKALVHYHFRDKRQLLEAVVSDCVNRIQRRGETGTDSPSDLNPVEGFQRWVRGEFKAGDLQVLVHLTHAEDGEVRHASATALGAVRIAVAERIGQVFEQLEAPAPLPAGLMGRLMTAVMIGEASIGPAEFGDDRRQLLDVLWLALLRLGD